MFRNRILVACKTQTLFDVGKVLNTFVILDLVLFITKLTLVVITIVT